MVRDMDPEEGSEGSQGADGAGDDGGDAAPPRDVSDAAIEARMAELGYADGNSPAADDDAVDGDPDDAPAKPTKKGKAEAKPAADDAVEGDKPADEKAPTTEEGKSWQAKMKAEGEKAKAEISTLAARVQKADERDREWMKAANDVLLELRSSEQEVASLRAQLKQAGIEEDPRSAELRAVRLELERAKGGQTLQQKLAAQQQQQAQLAIAQQEKTTVEREARSLIAKHKELADPGVGEEILNLWSAAVSLAEKNNKKPPSMTAFVEKQLAALRFEKQRPKIDAKRAQLQKSRKAPPLLNGNGSSGVPAKFPSTDEGIAAWAKARGFD